MAYDYSQAGYSQDVLDYVNSLDARRNELLGKYAGQNVGLDNPDFLTPQQVQQEASDGFTTQYAPEEVIREYMSRNPLNSANNLNAGVDVRSYGDSRDPSVYDMVRLPFGDDYTFTNNATGDARTLSTPEELGKLAQSINLGTGNGNNTSNWSVTNGGGEQLAYDAPYTPSLLKQTGQTISDLLVEYGPSILAIPMTGGMSLGALMATAGGTAALGKLLKTGDLEKSIISGLTSAATAGALKASGASDFLGKKLGEYGISMPTGASTAPSFAGPSSTAFSGVDLSSTLPGFAAGTSFGGAIAPPSGATEAIQVGFTKGAAVPVASGLGSLAGNVAGNALPQGPRTYTGPSTYQPDGTEAVTTTGYRAPITPVTSAVLPAIASSLNSSGYETGPSTYQPDGTEAVTTTGYRAPITPVTSAVLPPLGSMTAEQWLTSQAAKNAAEPIVGEPVEEPSDFDKYLRYASLGLTGASLLGGLFGGGSGSGAGSSGMVGDSGKMPANFATDKLPTGDAVPTFGGGTSLAARTARPAADFGDIDYNRYGFNPEKSFFNNVPQRAAKGGSMAVTRPAKSYAVQGAGDGRSDDIPAVLSDGEYVIDAETVALLGNGSNKAGAAQLDRFRANVRKHKGKELAKGRFSVNAKNPQAYMAGGRS
jgi:hypothetical protein